ncbi:hypothetical protein [Haloglycomyces albus]|uniref:hypothetical protein n=1 Tax=Haloglycomyces albus TaxID=526067 RepID=UPI00046D3609|nr:hypothetical protein [Haloglycomyces albus]
MDRVDSHDSTDVETFARRVARFDTTTVVRIDPAEGDTRALWAVLPIDVVVHRIADSHVAPGRYHAEALLESVPAASQSRWRQRLPKSPLTVVESIPETEIYRIDQAAAAALRERRGHGIGDRRLRDVLLDHVVIQVESAGRRLDVRQRLVSGLMRMAFLGGDLDGHVQVLCDRSDRVGLRARNGEVWELDRTLSLTPR